MRLVCKWHGVREEGTKGNFSDPECPPTSASTYKADRHLTPIQHPSQHTCHECMSDSVPNLHSPQRRKSASGPAQMCSKSSLKHLLWNRTLWRTVLYLDLVCVWKSI